MQKYIKTTAKATCVSASYSERRSDLARLDSKADCLAWSGGTSRTVDRFLCRVREALRGFDPGGIGPREI